MDNLILVKPTIDLKEQALDYRQEHFDKGEKIINGSALLDNLTYEEWLEHLEKSSNPDTVAKDWVDATTFFVVRTSDNRKIGYSVRQKKKKKGYGTEILKQALEYAKTININNVMLACYKENEGSRKIIVKCGGKLEKEFTYIDGKIIQVYWIDN